MKNIQLDSYEQSIEDEAEFYMPVSLEKREKVQHILQTISKNQSVNVRLSEQDWQTLKQKSIETGRSYQTLISDLIHQYLVNQSIGSIK